MNNSSPELTIDALGGKNEVYKPRDGLEETEASKPNTGTNPIERERAPIERPRPLRRELPPPAPFPVEALSCAPVLRDTVEAIQMKTRAPMALCGNSVLAASSLCAQAHGDVQMPYDIAKPLSLFFITVAETGERKSSVDQLALAPIRAHEAQLRKTYGLARNQYETELASYAAHKAYLQQHHKKDLRALRAALAELGPEPSRPLAPLLLVDNPTVEGLETYAANGQPSFGLFTAEGGKLIGGHLLNDDNRMKAGATLNLFWDAAPVPRLRKDIATKLPGRRLAMNIMVQPEVSMKMLADPTLASLGTLSRFLVAAPVSAAGSRLWRETPSDVALALRNYGDAVAALLSKEPQKGDEPNELRPPVLQFTRDARSAWIEFHNETEFAMKPDAPWEPIKGLAAKLPEHAARIAGILTMMDNPLAIEIGLDAIDGGIALCRYYAGEALRLVDSGATNPDLILAGRLLNWLQQRPEDAIYLAKIYQAGPRPIRDQATAGRIIRILEDHGWVRRVRKPIELDGALRKEAWLLIR